MKMDKKQQKWYGKIQIPGNVIVVKATDFFTSVLYSILVRHETHDLFSLESYHLLTELCRSRKYMYFQNLIYMMLGIKSL